MILWIYLHIYYNIIYDLYRLVHSFKALCCSHNIVLLSHVATLHLGAYCYALFVFVSLVGISGVEMIGKQKYTQTV